MRISDKGRVLISATRPVKNVCAFDEASGEFLCRDLRPKTYLELDFDDGDLNADNDNWLP